MKKLDFFTMKKWLGSNLFSKTYHRKISLEGYLSTQGFTKKMRESFQYWYNQGEETFYIGLTKSRKLQSYDKFKVYHHKLKFLKFNLSVKYIDKYYSVLGKYGFSFYYCKSLIYISTSLKKLLENTKYEDYMGKVRVYGVYRGLPKTKIHIGRIWKVDILDEEGDIVDTFENKEMKEFVDNHERYK